MLCEVVSQRKINTVKNSLICGIYKKKKKHNTTTTTNKQTQNGEQNCGSQRDGEESVMVVKGTNFHLTDE